jgi:hypothetical protein
LTVLNVLYRAALGAFGLGFCVLSVLSFMFLQPGFVAHIADIVRGLMFIFVGAGSLWLAVYAEPEVVRETFLGFWCDVFCGRNLRHVAGWVACIVVALGIMLAGYRLGWWL